MGREQTGGHHLEINNIMIEDLRVEHHKNCQLVTSVVVFLVLSSCFFAAAIFAATNIGGVAPLFHEGKEPFFAYFPLVAESRTPPLGCPPELGQERSHIEGSWSNPEEVVIARAQVDESSGNGQHGLQQNVASEHSLGFVAGHSDFSSGGLVRKYAVKSRGIDGRDGRCRRTEDCIKHVRGRKCGSPCVRGGRAAFSVLKAGNGLAAGTNTYSNPDAQVLLAWMAGLDDGPSNVFSNWNFSVQVDFCLWRGVQCDNSSTHVISLKVAGRRLAGSIPSGLSGLPFLATLDLSYNHLSGAIPADLANISSLQTLDLSFNRLNGSIPPFGNNSSSLQSLNLLRNKIAGGIPVSLGECIQLTQLNLARNKLSGDIPSELATLLKLQELQLYQNRLGGDLPPSFGSFSGLLNLSLGQNLLTGSIPGEYSNLTALQALYLQGNNFSGDLPVLLADLPNLAYLDLSSNGFTGEIPQLLGNTRQLRSLNLSSNSLSGSIPTALSESVQMFEIDLSENQLSGLIPVGLGSVTALQQLRLAQNLLTGPIPTNLTNCRNLVEIALSSNQLSGPILSLDTFSQLQRLSLDGNLLNGTIPSLTNLTNLSVLDLSKNSLTGFIPSDVGQLKNLSSLDLSANFLAGPLPELGSIANLTSLNLEQNLLNGTIPATLGNLVQLQVLSLGSNQFVGSIPPQLSASVNLTTLTLNDNGLNGSIPDSLGHFQSLRVMYLQGNQLSGQIPTTFTGLTTLQDLVVSDNQLGGEISVPLLSTLSHLQANFSLANNRMTGQLPAELGLLSMVKTLNLSGNSFVDAIPDEIVNCRALQRLDLSNNELTGVIPSVLESLAFLQVLNVSHNSLNGSIPSSFGNLTDLVQLDVTGNNLSGEIPSSLASLPNLVFLNVSYNDLQGMVPQGGDFNNFSASSFLGNPLLCGPIVNRSCNAVTSGGGHHKGSLSTGAEVGIAVGGSVALLALSAAAGLLWWRVVPWGRTPEKRGSIIARSELFFPQLRFTIQDLKLATEDFSSVNILGEGGLSIVYRGVLPELVLVAVKKLKFDNGTVIPPGFIEELDELGRLRHRNLVAILGHCFEMDMNALVVQYMSNGSLEQHLHGGPDSDLDWPARSKISIGVAKALTYLHHDCGTVIVHCDVKPSNVLLDADFEAHLEDFGLSRLIFAHKLIEMTDSSVGSSVGYFPPEYGYSPIVSPKGDVYSYGILLLELLTGKKPTMDMFKEDMSLVKWCQSSFPNKIMDVLDPSLVELKDTSEKQVMLFMKVALMCAKETPEERPTMKTVLDMLR